MRRREGIFRRVGKSFATGVSAISLLAGGAVAQAPKKDKPAISKKKETKKKEESVESLVREFFKLGSESKLESFNITKEVLEKLNNEVALKNIKLVLRNRGKEPGKVGFYYDLFNNLLSKKEDVDTIAEFLNDKKYGEFLEFLYENKGNLRTYFGTSDIMVARSFLIPIELYQDESNFGTIGNVVGGSDILQEEKAIKEQSEAIKDFFPYFKKIYEADNEILRFYLMNMKMKQLDPERKNSYMRFLRFMEDKPIYVYHLFYYLGNLAFQDFFIDFAEKDLAKPNSFLKLYFDNAQRVFAKGYAELLKTGRRNGRDLISYREISRNVIWKYINDRYNVRLLESPISPEVYLKIFFEERSQAKGPEVVDFLSTNFDVEIIQARKLFAQQVVSGKLSKEFVERMGIDNFMMVLEDCIFKGDIKVEQLKEAYKFLFKGGSDSPFLKQFGISQLLFFKLNSNPDTEYFRNYTTRFPDFLHLMTLSGNMKDFMDNFGTGYDRLEFVKLVMPIENVRYGRGLPYYNLMDELLKSDKDGNIKDYFIQYIESFLGKDLQFLPHKQDAEAFLERLKSK